MHRLSLLVLLTLFACQSSYSSRFQNEEGGYPEPSRLLTNSQGENKQFAAIGRLHGAMSCTAVLWSPSAQASGPALVLTNGHCVQSFADRATSYETLLLRPAPKNWSVIFNAFVDTQTAQKSYQVKNILYSTMNALDLAILELDVSLAQLKEQGLLPVPQADKSPGAGSAIRVLGLPEQGFPAEEQFLREASCVEETQVSIVEWYWHWFDMHRNSCADIREGSSGSAVLNAEGQIYALLNTTSQGGISESCYLGNPCELQTPGAFMLSNKNYAANLVDLPACFDSKGTFQLKGDCPLPGLETLVYTGAPNVPTRPVDLQNRPILWNLKTSSQSFDQLRWKLISPAEGDCREKKGYSELLPIDAPILTGQAIPNQAGIYLLCLWGSHNREPADLRFPTVVVLSIDTKSPSLKPSLSLRVGDDHVSFEPIFQVPELSSFWLGFGPAATTSCDSLRLSPYRRIPVNITAEDLPAKICVQGEDHAGNRGPIFEYAAP